MNGDLPEAASRLQEVLATVAVPESLMRSWRQSPSEVGLGTMWRADWEGAAALVIIVETEPRLLVAPVTVEPDLRGWDTRHLGPGSSPLGVHSFVWPNLAVEVASCVLGHYVGSVASYDPSEADANTPGRSPDVWESRSVRLYRATLRDACEALSEAQWIEPETATDGRKQLNTLISFGELVELLDASPQRALAIWRGRALLELDEATRLATAMGMEPAELLDTNPRPPKALINSFDSISRSFQVRAFARQHGMRTPDAYRAIAYSVWGLAARQTGATEIDWRLRLDAYFSALEGSAEFPSD